MVATPLKTSLVHRTEPDSPNGLPTRQTGFVVAVAGALLILAGEVGRRKKPAPKSSIRQ